MRATYINPVYFLRALMELVYTVINRENHYLVDVSVNNDINESDRKLEPGVKTCNNLKS